MVLIESQNSLTLTNCISLRLKRVIVLDPLGEEVVISISTPALE
eukprot:UN07755